MVSAIAAIVGAAGDPVYGPVLLVGSGGVLVGLVADAALRLLPVTAREASTMVDGLKLAKRLSGFRGQPAADRAAFEAAALALARFFLDHRARIKDIEINPLMVQANNQSPAHDPQSKVQKPAGADPSVVAVDVRVLWRGDGGGTEREMILNFREKCENSKPPPGASSTPSRSPSNARPPPTNKTTSNISNPSHGA